MTFFVKPHASSLRSRSDPRPSHSKYSQVVERDTRDAQNVVPDWACEFDSRLGYFLDCRCGRCPVGFHKPDEPGSIPGPATLEV